MNINKNFISHIFQNKNKDRNPLGFLKNKKRAFTSHLFKGGEKVNFQVHKKGEGFTLIEIMIAITIFIFTAIILNRFLFEGFRSLTFVSEQEEAIEDARDAMEIIVTEVREANASEKGHYALSAIEEQEFIYYSDINNDGQTEKIHYFLEDSELKKSIIEPGPTNDYDGQATTSTLAYYINNQTEPIFIYYDSNKEETAMINNVRLIYFNLIVNITPERKPDDYTAISCVHLRNLKDNL